MLKIEKNSHPFDLPELNNMMKNAKEIGFKHKVNVICTSIFSLHRFGQKLPNRVILLKLDLVQAFYPSGVYFEHISQLQGKTTMSERYLVPSSVMYLSCFAYNMYEAESKVSHPRATAKGIVNG